MIGQRLLHFRILDRLGVGGMGEVFRAEDTKLGREVALKLLSEDVASDPERLHRFEREAKILGSLNHPNVAAVYSFETARLERVQSVGGEESDRDSTEQDRKLYFLVLELVEGRTLDELIALDGMPLQRFFEIAIALTDGVAAAHDKGIVHRDLKPSNVMVTAEGRTKVLDFGVAKLEPGFGADSTALQTQALTVEGKIIGTVPYMSPEQVRGDAIDARSDIFSLGSIFYQMVTGERPFAGDKPPEVLASILKDEPRSLRSRRPDAPRQLERIVLRCLAKDPNQRFQSARDLLSALADLEQELEVERQISTTAETQIHDAAEGSQPNRRPVAVLSLLAMLVVVGVLWRLSAPRSETSVETDRATEVAPADPNRLFGPLRQVTSGSGLEEWATWSPDGERLVFSAEADGFMNLFMRDLSGDEPRRLTVNPSDDIQATFSPDGVNLLFVRASGQQGKLNPSDVMGWYTIGGDIWRLDLESGEEERLIDDAFNPAFNPDGSAILIDADWAGPRRIWMSDARGRNPKQLTNDVSEAAAHANADWSPDGSRIVYRRIQQTSSDIVVMDLDSELVTAITADDYNDLDPRFSPDGRFIYFSSYRSGGLNLWRVPVSSAAAPIGPAQQVTRGAGNDLQAALSPAGDRLAFTVLSINSDIWRLPVDPSAGTVTGAPAQVVASEREDSRASWHPDGDKLVFNSNRAGDMNLWELDVAAGTTRQLTSGPGGDFQPRYSPAAATVLFFSGRSGNNDIWSLALETGELERLTDHDGLDINPFYSLDGTRIVFQSDRDGRLELWIMNADGSDQTRLTSVGSSGHFSPWTPDGESIVFRSGLGESAKIFAIDVVTEQLTRLPPITSGAHMSFSPDGRLVADVRGHKTLVIYDLETGRANPVFEFDSPSTRIDYPLWSPDGEEIVFDRAEPRGGDIWILEGL